MKGLLLLVLGAVWVLLVGVLVGAMLTRPDPVACTIRIWPNTTLVSSATCPAIVGDRAVTLSRDGDALLTVWEPRW